VANRKEKHQAKDMGGSRVPMSGALDGKKGDIQVGDFLLDHKYTCKLSINISGTQLAKISKEAREEGKRPGLLIELENTAFGTPKTWVIVPQIDFQEIIDVQRRTKG